MRKILLTFLFCVLSVSAFAESYTGLITDIIVPSKILGFGGAYVGVKGDIDSLYSNPAGIDKINNNEVLSFYQNYYQNLSLMSIGGIYLFPYIGPVGGKFSYFGMPSDGDVAFYEFSASVGYGYSVMNILDVGGNLNFVHSQLSTFSANAVTVDLSLQYTIEIPKTLNENIIGLGLVVKNLGTGLKYKNKLTPFERDIVLGLVYKFKSKYIFLYDAELKNSHIFSHAGFQYNINKYFQLRVGWNNTGQNNKLYFGSSFAVEIQNFDFDIDYTFNPVNNFGVINHNISLSIKF